MSKVNRDMVHQITIFCCLVGINQESTYLIDKIGEFTLHYDGKANRFIFGYGLVKENFIMYDVYEDDTDYLAFMDAVFFDKPSEEDRHRILSKWSRICDIWKNNPQAAEEKHVLVLSSLKSISGFKTCEARLDLEEDDG